MKKNSGWLIAILIMFFCGTSFAAPFLVSDPPPPCGVSGQAACPESVDLFVDAEPLVTGLALEPNHSIRYDLTAMPTGEHEYTAKYNYSAGRKSDLSDPFLFLAVGGPPLNLNAVP